MTAPIDTQPIESLPEAATHQERLRALREGGVEHADAIGAADTNAEFRTKRFALDLFSREEVEIGFSDYLFGVRLGRRADEPPAHLRRLLPDGLNRPPGKHPPCHWTGRYPSGPPVGASHGGGGGRLLLTCGRGDGDLSAAPCSAAWSSARGVSAMSRWRAVQNQFMVFRAEPDKARKNRPRPQAARLRPRLRECPGRRRGVGARAWSVGCSTPPGSRWRLRTRRRCRGRARSRSATPMRSRSGRQRVPV